MHEGVQTRASAQGAPDTTLRLPGSNMSGLKFLNFSKSLIVVQKRSSKSWLHQLWHLKINIMQSAKLILTRVLPPLQCS